MNVTDKWENVFGPDDSGVTDGKAVQQVHEHDDDQEHEGQQEQVAGKEDADEHEFDFWLPMNNVISYHQWEWIQLIYNMALYNGNPNWVKPSRINLLEILCLFEPFSPNATQAGIQFF